MRLKRYDMIVRQSGHRMEERTDGDFVLADQAQAEIDRLAEALQLLEAAKDCLPSDDLVYLRIRDFLDQK